MWPFTRRGRRGLFKYWDGRKTCYADPVAVSCALTEDSEFRMDIHPKLVFVEQDPDALRVTVNAIMNAFSVKQVPATWSGSTPEGLWRTRPRGNLFQQGGSTTMNSSCSNAMTAPRRRVTVT